MIHLNFSKLENALIGSLKELDYAILTIGITNSEFPLTKIALSSKERETFLHSLREKVDFQIIQSKLDSTILTINLKNDQLYTLELLHYFHSDRLIYLDIKEVLKNKKRSNKGYYIPSREHLLEFNIFNSFLNEEGLNDAFIKQFEDLHIFLQEGLLDYFNTKYDTFFTNLHELTDYKETIENHFRKQLRQLPANKFSNRMRLGWINIKGLLKRSAVFSYLH
jgi:hypothetical protein